MDDGLQGLIVIQTAIVLAGPMAARLPPEDTLQHMVAEMWALPLKDAVKEIWLYGSTSTPPASSSVHNAEAGQADFQ